MEPQLTLRLDAAENAFFLRDLAAIEAELHDTDYPEIKYTKYLPTETGFAPGAASLIYRQFTGIGQAKLITDKSKDLPRVDVKGEEVPTKVWPIGDSFGYSIMEIKGAAQAAKKKYPGMSLDRQRANWAHEAIERKLEKTAALGDTEAAIKGLCNHSAVTAGTAANGAAGTATWVTKTPDEILADINGMVEYMRDDTLGVESPDALLLPEKQFGHIASRRLTDSDSKTILKFLLESQEFIKHIGSWHFLKAAGAGSTDRAVAYRRDPMKLKLRNPHGYMQMEPRRVGLEYLVECFMTTAGVIIYKPRSVYYLDGI